MMQNAALIVVDVQKGFTPGGNLAVTNADQIIPNINRLGQYFQNIVLTQDWHPAEHISFADNHPAQAAYDTIQLDYGSQVLWPSHCVQGTEDAEFHPELNLPQAQLIIRKGFHQNIDSYSAFMEADQKPVPVWPAIYVSVTLIPYLSWVLRLIFVWPGPLWMPVNSALRPMSLRMLPKA